MFELHEIETILEQFLGEGLEISWFFNFISSGLSIAGYVLSALALYTLANRRGIRNAWLSWVPLVNCWIIGCLSDQYRYVVKGEVKNKRKALLALNIISVVLGIVLVIVVVVMIIGAARSAIGADEEELVGVILGALVGIFVLWLPIVGVSIATKIIHYMSTYDIYTSCTPQNNVLFLVLSIIFPITEPFFLFFTRNKDEGMPPRRQPAQYVPQQPQYEPPQFV